MPRKCYLCQHSEAAQINAFLLDWGTQEATARRFGVSASSVFRHKRDCLAPKLATRRISAALSSGSVAWEATANKTADFINARRLAQETCAVLLRHFHRAETLRQRCKVASVLAKWTHLLAKLEGGYGRG